MKFGKKKTLACNRNEKYSEVSLPPALEFEHCRSYCYYDSTISACLFVLPFAFPLYEKKRNLEQAEQWCQEAPFVVFCFPEIIIELYFPLKISFQRKILQLLTKLLWVFS